jgi:hypothetical protein
MPGRRFVDRIRISDLARGPRAGEEAGNGFLCADLQKECPMSRFVLAFVVLGLASGVAFAGSPAEKEVQAALDTWKHAMMKKDAGAFDRVFHAELSYGHSTGVIENKTQATDHVMKSTTVYDAITFADTKISVRGNTALVTGKVQYQKHPKDKAVIEQNLVVLSIWVKTPKGWQMLARQSTEPNPSPALRAAAP